MTEPGRVGPFVHIFEALRAAEADLEAWIETADDDPKFRKTYDLRQTRAALRKVRHVLKGTEGIL